MKKSQLPIVFGLGISALLTLTFLLFAAFGLHTNPAFSIFNGVIMAVGMFMCLKAYKEEKGNDFNYQKGFVAVFFTGFNATLFFTMFFVFFASIIEPTYISSMIGHWSSHYNTPEGLVVFVVFIMGMATTMVLSLAFMQLFKKSWNTSSTKDILKMPSALKALT